ncbi:hypothetical protein [Thalassotalea maritima]|uniref:hypothetical protein n=1 Tax=Thalassotalea maritima TaxID=3242416 RepID=UPI0035284F6F
MKILQKVSRWFVKSNHQCAQKVEVDLNCVDTTVEQDSIFGELERDKSPSRRTPNQIS